MKPKVKNKINIPEINDPKVWESSAVKCSEKTFCTKRQKLVSMQFTASSKMLLFEASYDR